MYRQGEYSMQIRTSYSETLRRFLNGLGMLLTAVVVLAGQAQAAPILTFDQLHNGGTLSYNGTTGALKGRNIIFESIIGVDTAANDGVTLSCTGCLLNFKTGANMDNTGPGYEWSGGGYFKLTGTVTLGNEVIASGILLSGTWDDTVYGTRIGPDQFFVTGGGTDTKNPRLLDFFGLLPGGDFKFANTNISAVTNSYGNGFIANVTEADITNTGPTATPEPTTMLLFGAGLLGLAGYRWRRQPQKVNA
jgi:hypothetical protein